MGAFVPIKTYKLCNTEKKWNHAVLSQLNQTCYKIIDWRLTAVKPIHCLRYRVYIVMHHKI